MAKKQIDMLQALSSKQIRDINEGFRVIYQSESEEIKRMKEAFAKYGIK